MYYSTKYYSTTFRSWRLLPKYVHSFGRTTHDRQLFLGPDRGGSSVHDLLHLTNKAKLSSGWSVMIHWPENSWKWVDPIQSQIFLGWYFVLFKTKGPRERIVSIHSLHKWFFWSNRVIYYGHPYHHVPYFFLCLSWTMGKGQKLRRDVLDPITEMAPQSSDFVNKSDIAWMVPVFLISLIYWIILVIFEIQLSLSEFPNVVGSIIHIHFRGS